MSVIDVHLIFQVSEVKNSEKRIEIPNYFGVSEICSKLEKIPVILILTTIIKPMWNVPKIQKF